MAKHLAILIIFLMLPTFACGEGNSEAFAGEAEPHVGYAPPFLPIQFTYSSSGLEITGDLDFVTPIGTFTIGATIPIDKPLSSKDLILILRNRETGRDDVYLIMAGRNARIVVDGRTVIDVGLAQVTVDVTDASIIELSAPERVNIVNHGISVSCENAPSSNLWIGINAKVNVYKVNVRTQPEVPQIWDENIVAALSEGTQVSVIGGPACAHGGYWWQISTDNGVRGWMREENDDGILLAPAQ